MKKIYFSFKATLFITTALFTGLVSAQCPTITCPANISVNAAPGTCGAVVNFTAPVGTNPCGTGTQTFNYTGALQTFTVPANVYSITADISGAEGGLCYYVAVGGSGGHITGKGGRTQATWAVTPGQVYNIFVGQKGFTATTVGGAGGFNGGALGGTYNSNQGGGGGGGGASDIRFGGVALANRILVAGGDGGAGYNYASGDDGGNGGGLIGANGETNNNPYLAPVGGGGTQSTGGVGGVLSGWVSGVAGTLGNGGIGGSNSMAGGGAGGYYGGGGGAFAGGGGGSSYTDPSATGITHTQGYRTGNGQVILNWVTTPTTVRVAGLASGSTFPVGTTVETYTVTDQLGNTQTCSFNIIVTDNQLPTIASLPNLTVNNDPGVCGAKVYFTAPVGSDNCVSTTTQISGLVSGSVFPIGVTTQTYRVTDASGNMATSSYTITVVDNENPVITSSNITVNNDPGMCGAVVNYVAPVGTDNCAGTTTVLTSGLGSGSTFPVGSSTETYTATDAAGHTSSTSFTVTVIDNELPVITSPSNVSVICNPVVNGIGPVSSGDNCSVAGISYALSGATIGAGNNDASGNTFNPGTTTVTYTATDASGNMGSSSFTVTLVPNYTIQAVASICQGKSIMLGGAMQTMAGTYNDTLTSAMGCDSVIMTTLTINALPNVLLNPFNKEILCEGDGPIPLPAAAPSGGIYTGTGIVGNNFDPAVSGTGAFWIVYSSTNANGCTNSDSSLVTVATCTGIAESAAMTQPVIYPNPSNGLIHIVLGKNYEVVSMEVSELSGRLVRTEELTGTSLVTSDLSDLAKGMYFIRIKADGNISTLKLIKN